MAAGVDELRCVTHGWLAMGVSGLLGPRLLLV